MSNFDAIGREWQEIKGIYFKYLGDKKKIHFLLLGLYNYQHLQKLLAAKRYLKTNALRKGIYFKIHLL